MNTELEKTLKRAITESGVSHYRLGLDCGISPRSIGRFIQGTRTLRLDIAGRIAKRLGLSLRKDK